MPKHAVSMTVIASIVGVLANVPTTAQTLNVDPARDQALLTPSCAVRLSTHPLLLYEPGTVIRRSVAYDLPPVSER